MHFCNKSPDCPMLWFLLWSGLGMHKLDSIWMKLNCSMCSSSTLSVIQLSTVFILVYIRPHRKTYSKDTECSAPLIPLYRCSSGYKTCYWTAKVLVTTFSLFSLFSDCSSGSGSSSELRYLKGAPAKGNIAWASPYKCAHRSWCIMHPW